MGVEPVKGITLETRLKLTATGWVDEHMPLTYRFSLRPVGDDKASWISLSSRSESPEARNVLIGGVGNFTIQIGVRDAQGLEASSTCSVEMLAPVVAKTNDELKEIIDVVAVSDSAPASSDDGGDQKSKVAAETGRETSGLISEEEQKRRDEKHRIIRQRKRRDVVAAR